MTDTGGRNRQNLRARLGEETYDLSIEERDGAFRVHVGEECFTVERRSLGDRGLTSLLIDHRPYEVKIDRHPAGFSVTVCGVPHTVEILDPLAALVKKVARKRAGPEMETVAAPMPGMVVSVEVNVGDRVEAGMPLVVVEAMKMQNELAAQHAGIVRQVRVSPGQKVDTNEVLLVLEPA